MGSCLEHSSSILGGGAAILNEAFRRWGLIGRSRPLETGLQVMAITASLLVSGLPGPAWYEQLLLSPAVTDGVTPLRCLQHSELKLLGNRGPKQCSFKIFL